jgi:putative hemolysin
MLLQRLRALLVFLLLPALVLAAPGSAAAFAHGHQRAAVQVLAKSQPTGSAALADCHTQKQAGQIPADTQLPQDKPACCELPCCQIMTLTIAPLVAQPRFTPSPAQTRYTPRLVGNRTGGLERPPRTTNIG